MFKPLLVAAILALAMPAEAQMSIDETGTMTERKKSRKDSLGTDKEVPQGMYAWKVDRRFGDQTSVVPDTVPFMFMNTVFTTGMRGEFNTLGNNGSPRQNRIFIDRKETSQFSFLDPYDFFVPGISDFHFTNTLSPITNLSYYSCGDKTNGEDHFKALFAVNANKRLGFLLKFDYLYDRGYYANQSNSHFNTSFLSSYLGDRYNMHFIFTIYNQKVSENGGITNDEYISHPESFSDDYTESEIPTMLNSNWNRNKHWSVFLTHRYSFGYHRKVKMTEEEIKAKKFAMQAAKDEEQRKEKERKRKAGEEMEGGTSGRGDKPVVPMGRPKDAKIMGDAPTIDKKPGSDRITVDGEAQRDSLLALEKKEENPDTAWMKRVYVPVTSVIHTAEVFRGRRIYQAYKTPTSYYNETIFSNGVLAGDSIYDETKFLSVRNTFALALLEGFNKWAQSGIKLFLTHDLRRVTMPDSTGIGRTKWTEHDVSIGGQLSRTQGKVFHYNVIAETWLMGENAGQLKVDGSADLNFKLFGDTVQLAAKAFIHRLNPTFFYRHFQGKHAWWDNDGLSKEIRTRIEGDFSLKRTGTTLRVAFDDISNYTYIGQSYTSVLGSNNRDYSYCYNQLNVRQKSNVGIITAQLMQNLRLGPLHWDNVITYQKSTDSEVLPLPDLNVYTNLYLRFRIARVLDVDLGADARYFTKYYAPAYSPYVGNYVVQEQDDKVKIGNCPIVNVYANLFLKHARFFVMMSHVAGAKNYFYTPHYPLNSSVIRFGVSWNFLN